jgi:hypothetical protein
METDNCENYKRRIRNENKAMAYRLGDIIRKQNDNIKKPDDIGTKPIPKWMQN